MNLPERNRTRKVRSCLGFTFALMLIPLIQACHQERFDSPVIGKNGNITAIVLPDSADDVVKFAAVELQDYLGRMTGADLGIVRAGDLKRHSGAIRFSLEKDPGVEMGRFPHFRE